MKFKEYLTKDNLKNTIRQYKGFGFLVSIILIILSILMFIFPSLFSYLSIWIFIIGLTFAGFFSKVTTADFKLFSFESLIKFFIIFLCPICTPSK